MAMLEAATGEAYLESLAKVQNLAKVQAINEFFNSSSKVNSYINPVSSYLGNQVEHAIQAFNTTYEQNDRLLKSIADNGNWFQKSVLTGLTGLTAAGKFLVDSGLGLVKMGVDPMGTANELERNVSILAVSPEARSQLYNNIKQSIASCFDSLYEGSHCVGTALGATIDIVVGGKAVSFLWGAPVSAEVVAETSTVNVIGKPIINTGGAVRRSWRETENIVEALFPEGRPQVSFKNGVEVPYGTEGSVRPDVFISQSKQLANLAVEAKNFNLLSENGIANLVKNVRTQIMQRLYNLPSDTGQQIIVDIGGQNVTRSVIDNITSQISEGFSNITVKFIY